MYLTGGIPPQPMVYRCSVDEEWRIQLPVEVRQALNVRPEHRVDLTVKGNKVEMAHAWPCCQLCGGAERLRRLRRSVFLCAVSYTHLTLPTNSRV